MSVCSKKATVSVSAVARHSLNSRLLVRGRVAHTMSVAPVRCLLLTYL